MKNQIQSAHAEVYGEDDEEKIKRRKSATQTLLEVITTVQFGIFEADACVRESPTRQYQRWRQRSYFMW